MSESTDKKIDLKAPYATPTLQVYGTIRDLTQGNVTMGMNDHIGGPQKTG
jgi:hypothetical protein